MTGYNDAFVIDGETRENLVAEDPKSAEIIKPWLRGKDLGKWGAKWAGLYFLFVRHSTDMREYPAILKHLKRHKPALLNRSAPGDDLWHAVQARTAYHRAFDEPKIVYPDIAKVMRAAYDKTGMFGGNTIYIIPTKDLSVLGFLHSRAFDWFARNTFSSLGDPWHGGRLRFLAQNMERVPFPPMGRRDRGNIARRVEAILRDPFDAEVPRLEAEVDAIVNRLYGLTAAEVRLVESGGG